MCSSQVVYVEVCQVFQVPHILYSGPSAVSTFYIEGEFSVWIHWITYTVGLYNLNTEKVLCKTLCTSF